MFGRRSAVRVCALAFAVLACGERGAAESGAAAGAAAKPAVPSAGTAVVAPGPSVIHVVHEGETLWDIARAYGVKVEAIQQANGLLDRKVRMLSKGTQLRIPGATAVIDVLAKKAAEQAKADML